MANDKKKSLLPKSSLIIRVVAGMYLIYLSYELFMGLGIKEAGDAPVSVSIISAVVFGICGLILVFFTVRDFLKGNFQGGIMDEKKEENT